MGGRLTFPQRIRDGFNPLGPERKPGRLPGHTAFFCKSLSAGGVII